MFSRRDFVKGAAALAAVGLVGLTRKSASGGAPPKAKRVLVVHADGGLRTTATFNASAQVPLNPWGVFGTAGVVSLGNLLFSTPEVISYAAPSWPGSPTVPDLAAAATTFALIGAADHAPGLPRAGDHPDDSQRMSTGYFGKDGAPGLLTALNKLVGGAAPAPVSVIGGGPLGLATGSNVAFAPVYLDYYGLPSEPPTGGSPAVGRPLEDAIDGRLRARRGGLARAQIDGYLGVKSALRKYGPVLADKSLHMNSPAYFGEVKNGITNRMLLEAAGNITSDSDAGHPDGIKTAMALRLLQLGSPAVALNIGGFDLHSEEQQKGPELYTRFARYLAGIHFALSNMVDEANTPMIDSTLVVTTSEFGRSTGGPNGFNDGLGSDHGDGAPWRYQSHVAFGAGITPKVLAPTDDGNNPKDKVCSTHALLATICLAVGAAQDEVDKLWPPGTDLYPEALPIEELWS